MDATPEEKKSARRAAAIKLGVVAFVVAALFGLTLFVDIPGALQGALKWIEGLGLVGAGFFILLYILASIFLLPGSILTLGAGAIYGPFNGTLLVSIASTLGATGAFLVGRYLARDWIGKKIAGNKKFDAIDKAVAQEGWKIVGLVRLVPVIPFNLLNYALSLTRVTLRDYVLASWIGMFPATVLYVYIGSAAARVATLGAEEEAAMSPATWALYGVGFAATVAVTILITRIAKRALQDRVELGSDSETSET
jgi:uncharacterized membrane protein YdjX (TVP38/TMEM64 family)